MIDSNRELFKYSWIWEKSKATGFLNAKIRPLVAHENVLIFAKNKPPYNPVMTEGSSYNKGLRKEQTNDDVYDDFEQIEVKSDGLRYPRSVIYFKTAETEGEVYHKTQKPVALFEYLIKTYTNEDDLVLDNVSGSGTTAVACKNSNRNYICIEQDEEYYQKSLERIKNLN